MSWYRAGTIALTNGGTTITGSGTAFVGAVQPGWALVAPDNRVYQIAAVNSATSLTISTPYLGATQTGQAYQVFPTKGLEALLAAAVNNLITQFGAVVTGAGAGRFGDGTVAAPGIGYAADLDTGLRRKGANHVAVVTGGVDRFELTTALALLNLPLTGSAVTQTAIDATDGRLMKTGDFGLGASVLAVTLSNLDALNTPAGQYRTVDTATGVFPAGASKFGYVTISRHNVEQITQVYTPTGSGAGANSTFVRTYDVAAPAWLPWRQIYNAGNIRGGLSQTDGVPTGALFDTITNANGAAERFASGLQICHRRVTTSLAIGTTFWGGFRSNGQTDTYPASFVTAPRTSVTGVDSTAFGAISQGIPSTTSWSWAATAVTSQDAANRTVDLIATGRWF